jgi:hypothetical protein
MSGASNDFATVAQCERGGCAEDFGHFLINRCVEEEKAVMCTYQGFGPEDMQYSDHFTKTDPANCWNHCGGDYEGVNGCYDLGGGTFGCFVQWVNDLP